MTQKLLHRLLAAVVFLISAVQFFLTAQPSVSFWDPGELSAAANLLQVPHPPGGPLFSLLGHLLYLLPFPGNPGFRMNVLSVLCSTGVVLFLYLIAVRVIEIFRGKSSSIPEALTTYGSAAVGALALSFCDTFWFNGVEANYFASSTFIYAAMLWLTLVWYEKADEPRSTVYLLMIAYLVGLSSGVHLMSIPALFVVMMIVVFRKYIVNDAACKESLYYFLGHVAILALITVAMWNSETGTQPPTSEEYHAYDQRFVLIMAGISAVYLLVFRKKIFRKDSFYIPLGISAVALGAAYPGIIKKLPQALHLISGNDSTLGMLILFAILAGLGLLAWWSAKNQKTLLHLGALAALFVILGFTTYTTIVIRANAHTPMNENNPKNFAGLLSYINREQYGDFPQFKRRWTPEPDRQRTWTNYTSDLDFFARYQMQHMFNRYVLFNFAGSVSRDQDADWSLRPTFGIPLFIGLFGMFWHFRKDWRMATAFAVLFVIMGYLITFYQNQQEPQPRERDYFYGGAYLIFALWIAVGVRGLIDLTAVALKGRANLAAGGILILAVAFVPVRLFQINYHSHDRSRNWVPWDYSYNMLQTCEQDAILFTNGDNDTFPLWYLQDVEGVRRDIRIVNLSLVNTSWYIEQLKHEEPHGAKKVPVTISDANIADIQPIAWEPRLMDLSVPTETIEREAIRDTAVTNRGRISWMMPNTVQFGQVKAIRVQDIMVWNIIQANEWKRPVYFASTCSPDSRIGLDEYCHFCGLAWRLRPYKAQQADMGIEGNVLEANLFNEPTGYSKTPQYGYKFRCTSDTTVFYDENEVRMLSGFRTAFRAMAMYSADAKRDYAKSAATLERMEKVLPWSSLPSPLEEQIDIAFLYRRVGRPDRFNGLAGMIEQKFQEQLDAGRITNPYVYGAMIQIFEARNSFQKELDLLSLLSKQYPNDPNLKSRIDTIQARMKRGS